MPTQKAICIYCKEPVDHGGRMMWWHTETGFAECRPTYAAPLFVDRSPEEEAELAQKVRDAYAEAYPNVFDGIGRINARHDEGKS